jgi:3-hydroxybutyryl-CoA dehydrogenase
MDIKTIGVIGAGQMGAGIAQVFAVAGFDIILNDISNDACEKGVATITKSLTKFAEKGKISKEDAEKAIARIQRSSHFNDLKSAQCVIEAATENVKIKHGETILASNTSSISITDLAAQTDRPNKVIGMHFMNPVPIMVCVEVIRGESTNEPTFVAIRDLIKTLGKTMVVSKDRAGFIVNRILMPMINEAALAFGEEIASREDIDTAMKLSCGFPMGPLTLADFIGLDTCLSILEVMHRDLKDDKYKPAAILQQYVKEGRLGRKRKRGFYDY